MVRLEASGDRFGVGVAGEKGGDGRGGRGFAQGGERGGGGAVVLGAPAVGGVDAQIERDVVGAVAPGSFRGEEAQGGAGGVRL